MVMETYTVSAQNQYSNDPSVFRDPSGYKIRPGDRIRISIQGQPDCSAEVQINNQGLIRLTYVGGGEGKWNECKVDRVINHSQVPI